MAIDPNLLIIKPVSQLQNEPSPLNAKVLMYNGGGELKTTPLDDLKSLISAGVKGILKISDAKPSPSAVGKYDLSEVGTYTNLVPIIAVGSSTPSNTPITTLATDLNSVYWDGVNFTQFKKAIPQATQSIIRFTDSTFPLVAPAPPAPPIQRTHENSFYQLKDGQTANVTDIPGVSDKWILIGSKNIENDIMISNLIDEKDITGNIITGSYWRNDGTTASVANTKRTGKIAIKQADELWINTNWSLALFIVFFDSAGVFISSRTHTSGVLKPITPPSNAFYVGVSGQDNNTLQVLKRSTIKKSDISNTIDKVKVIPDSLANFAIPLVDEAVYGNYYYRRDTGALGNNTQFISTIQQRVNPVAQKILLNGTLAANSTTSLAFWDKDGVFIPYTQYKTSYSNEYITPPSNAVKFAFSKFKVDTLTAILVGNDLSNISLIAGTKSTADANKSNLTSSDYFHIGENFTKFRAEKKTANYGILISGQSNGVGLAPFSQLATLGLPVSLNGVTKWNGFTNAGTQPMTIGSSETWGVWWSVMKRMKDYKPNQDIFYYNSSVSGASISGWDPFLTTTDIVDKFANGINGMKDASTEINFKCMVWIQGEADYNSPNNTLYYQRLKNLIAFTRGIVGNPKLPFIVVGLHPSQNSYSAILRDSQIRAVSETEQAYFVNVDDLTYSSIGDNLHMDGVYMEALAPRIFDLIKDL